MKREQPIFAETFFFVKEDQISQSLYFSYYDVSRIYYNFMETGAIEGELDSISSHLQQFIDEDPIHVNGKLIKMNIVETSLFFRNKSPIYPVLCFEVCSTPYLIQQDTPNEIHLYAKPEVIPNPAFSYWNLCGKITQVKSRSYFVISTSKQDVTFYLTKGEIVGDDERIFFHSF